MKYSISEAARIVGVTRKTLYKHIENKPISVEKDNNDRPVIDASELIRVYGDQCQFDTGKTTEETATDTQLSTEVSMSEVTEMAVTKKELEMLKSQMSSERDSFEEQIDYLRNKLDEANSETRKLTALLTDQRTNKSDRAGEWEKSIKSLEQRIANQERSASELKEERQKILRQNHALKKQLEEERSKSLWQKLFGKKAG